MSIPAGAGALGWWDVQLDEADLQSGIRIGDAREGFGWENYLPIGGRRESIDGAYGEIAIARAYRAVWSEAYAIDPANMALPDVGGTDVRATRYPDGYLPLREERDHRERAYSLVLLLESRGLCRIAGWIYAFDGMVEAYRRPADANGPSFYAVPQSALTDPAWLPIERLPE